MLKWLRNTGQNTWGKGDRVYGLISEKESKTGSKWRPKFCPLYGESPALMGNDTFHFPWSFEILRIRSYRCRSNMWKSEVGKSYTRYQIHRYKMISFMIYVKNFLKRKWCCYWQFMCGKKDRVGKSFLLDQDNTAYKKKSVLLRMKALEADCLESILGIPFTDSVTWASIELLYTSVS